MGTYDYSSGCSGVLVNCGIIIIQINSTFLEVLMYLAWHTPKSHSLWLYSASALYYHL